MAKDDGVFFEEFCQASFIMGVVASRTGIDEK